jgi:hypothetical protein
LCLNGEHSKTNSYSSRNNSICPGIQKVIYSKMTGKTGEEPADDETDHSRYRQMCLYDKTVLYKQNNNLFHHQQKLKATIKRTVTKNITKWMKRSKKLSSFFPSMNIVMLNSFMTAIPGCYWI